MASLRLLLRTLLFVVALFSGVVRAQTTPPTISFTSPAGMQRGTHATLLVEGTSLEGATELVFSEPGLSATILQVENTPESRLALETKNVVIARPYFQDPVKMQMKVDVRAENWMAPGLHQFRVITPRGSSTPGKIMISATPEAEEAEPNDTLPKAQTVQLPVTVNGVVLAAGDNDCFRFQADAGQDLVFQPSAGALGSLLDPVISVYDAEGKQVASNRNDRGQAVLGHHVAVSGWYTVQVSDYLEGGSLRHFYRLAISAAPYLTRRFPLGMKAGTTRAFQISGFNLGETKTASPEPFGLLPGKVIDIGALAGHSNSGDTANVLPIAIGAYDEVDENGVNNTLKTAQDLKFPITVNGRILLDSSGKSLPDYYRFSARKGQPLILETAAARLGSHLDSVVEVFDSKGNLVPRLVAHPVWKTQLTLFDRESKSPGLRLAQTNGVELEDYMVSGSDLMKVVKLTNGPDEDIIFDSFGGQRLGIEDTTPEAHALDDFIYKVELHPPGTQFAPNGMPLFQFFMRNDDGGPEYGKDSRVTFTAPADGIYYARVMDVRNEGGEDFAYRFTIREPVPDFAITALPTNPNIPAGSRVPIEVTALREEGFNGPIDVQFEGLPESILGSSGVIPAGERSVTLVLSVKAGAEAQHAWSHYRIVGRAKVGSEEVTRVANGGDLLKLVSVMPAPDIRVSVKEENIRITPGGLSQVTLAVERFNGFRGRVLFRLQDLPYGVRPIDVGLNGVMIAENETERTFTLECRPFVKPTSRSVLAVGIVEALVPTEHSSRPVTLEVVSTESAAK